MSLDIGPKSSEKSIQEHLRHYYDSLNSGLVFPISSLFETYRRSHPSLHKLLDSLEPDYSALNYCLPRLPPCIYTINKVVIAQSHDQLPLANLDISTWELQGSPARRRQNYFDKNSNTLVILINSDSDIDDFINCLICFQIERQKFFQKPNTSEKTVKMFADNLNNFQQYHDITLQCLPKDDHNSEMVVADWWQKIKTKSLIFGFDQTPIYFVSSNLHSLTNLIGGFVNQRQDLIINHTEKNHPDLYQQWIEFKNGSNQLRVIDFLYYISAKYFKDLPQEATAKTQYEDSLGIRRLKISTQLPCDAQLIPISAIARSAYKDPNLSLSNVDKLLQSKAFILNIEYPLGFSAYFILKEMLTTLQNLKGVYVIGKAAILSGQIGDIQIPKAVFDERTNNILHPKNIFNEYFPFTAFISSILKDQKAISVYGTYLENEIQLKNYIDTSFNIIEMESGPYLTAIYKHVNHLESVPKNVVAHLTDLPFDLGIINYASDNPLSQTLGDSVMSLRGVEPTYLAALTAIQRIIDLESA
jgi:hypothetical protein